MAGQRDYLSYLQFSPERPSKQFEWTLLVPPHEGVPRVVPIPSCIIQPIQPTILPAQPSGRAPEQTHPQAPARLKPCKTSSFPPTRLTIRQRGLLHLKLGESNLEMKRKLGKSPCLGSTCSTLDLGGVLFKDFGMLRFTLYTTYVILPVVSATGWVSTPRVRWVGFQFSGFRIPSIEKLTVANVQVVFLHPLRQKEMKAYPVYPWATMIRLHFLPSHNGKTNCDLERENWNICGWGANWIANKNTALLLRANYPLLKIGIHL